MSDKEDFLHTHVEGITGTPGSVSIRMVTNLADGVSRLHFGIGVDAYTDLMPRAEVTKRFDQIKALRDEFRERLESIVDAPTH
ncbi:MAG: hypothetical protein Hals2KO_21790 [Halioglobus sp.]